MKFYVFCFANLLEIYKFSTSGEIVTSCNISPLSVTDRGEIGMTFQVRAGVSCLFCGVGMVVGVDVCICVVVCVCVCVRGAVGVRVVPSRPKIEASRFGNHPPFCETICV